MRSPKEEEEEERNVPVIRAHPDYGLHGCFGSEAVQYALDHSAKEAAEKFKVHVSTIYSWIKRSR